MWARGGRGLGAPLDVAGVSVVTACLLSKQPVSRGSVSTITSNFKKSNKHRKPFGSYHFPDFIFGDKLASK
ncbi:rCG41380 [Rattus norvegicus]|uniref:RCG41380 n=1 Tax=Rattus norvegicus TaxID=10116 RepID=A6IHG2_RAT|nr:rCG41380 [Rattus norvegicus]